MDFILKGRISDASVTTTQSSVAFQGEVKFILVNTLEKNYSSIGLIRHHVELLGTRGDAV